MDNKQKALNNLCYYYQLEGIKLIKEIQFEAQKRNFKIDKELNYIQSSCSVN